MWKLSFTLLVWLVSACDNPPPAAAPPVQPKTRLEKPWLRVHIGIPSLELPPYFIFSQQGGIEQDILREAFERVGYQAQFFRTKKREKRLQQKLEERQYHLECVSTVNENTKELAGVPGFFSNEVVTYHDVVITLHHPEKGLQLKTRDDLKGKVVEAFKGAQQYLGLGDVTKNNPLYHEHSGKSSQIVLLYRQRIDALIIEARIFQYLRKKLEPLVDIKQAVEVHDLFKPNSYKLFCVKQKHRDDFNRGLEELRQSGRYAQIEKSYLE